MALTYMEFSVQPSFLHRHRRLVVQPDQLSWHLPNGKTVTFIKENIEGYRYTVHGIRGYIFWIGRKYVIEICNHRQQVIRVQWWSLYGVRQKQMEEKYIAVITSLNTYYFNQILVHYIQLLKNELSFALCGVGLSPEGIADKKLGFIPWKKLRLKPYARFFSLYDAGNADNYRLIEYGADWNAAVLYAVVQHAMNRQTFRQNL